MTLYYSCRGGLRVNLVNIFYWRSHYQVFADQTVNARSISLSVIILFARTRHLVHLCQADTRGSNFAVWIHIKLISVT